jgi:iron complex outermembrane recepter protein
MVVKKLSAITLLPCKHAEIVFTNKYVSRQYLDNTQDKKRSIEPYFVQDFRATYNIKNVLFSNIQVIAGVNNIFNKKYEANGYTFSYIASGVPATENYYFPMAGTNYMAGVNISF